MKRRILMVVAVIGVVTVGHPLPDRRHRPQERLDVLPRVFVADVDHVPVSRRQVVADPELVWHRPRPKRLKPSVR